MSNVKFCTCKRCGWKWASRIKNPHVCPNPKCHSVNWNARKQNKNGWGL